MGVCHTAVVTGAGGQIGSGLQLPEHVGESQGSGQPGCLDALLAARYPSLQVPTGRAAGQGNFSLQYAGVHRFQIRAGKDGRKHSFLVLQHAPASRMLLFWVHHVVDAEGRNIVCCRMRVDQQAVLNALSI